MNIYHGFPSKRYAKIETSDFPEKFSIISRLKKESFMVGPGGDLLRSSVLPQVQVKVPEGAVASGTKLTLQVSTSRFTFYVTRYPFKISCLALIWGVFSSKTKEAEKRDPGNETPPHVSANVSVLYRGSTNSSGKTAVRLLRSPEVGFRTFRGCKSCNIMRLLVA